MRFCRTLFVVCLISLITFSCEKNSSAPNYNSGGGVYYQGIDVGIVYNGNLVVSGGYVPVYPSQYIVQWNGSSWQPLGSGFASHNGSYNPSALIIYNGNLIAGGMFDNAGGQSVRSVAQWNGTSWQALGNGISNSLSNYTKAWVDAMTVYNGNLIVGGNFKYAGSSVVNCIGQWNGSSWQSAAGGINDFTEDLWNPSVSNLLVYNGNLIALGRFDSIGGQSIPYVAQWNGASWTPVGGKFNMMTYSLTVYNGNLIADGVDSISGVPFIGVAQWNGTSWTAVPNLNKYPIYSSVTYNGNLCFNSYAHDTNLYQWTGSGAPTIIGSCLTTVHTLGNNIINPTYMVPLCVYNGNLIVGGWFTSVNGVSCTNIAKWNGTNWSAL
jgi:hypothetical protein